MEFDVVIEIPKGSRNKYEVDHDSGRVKLDESHAHALSVYGAERTGYGLGASGWVTVPLRAEGVSVALLRDWVEESYRIVAPKRVVAMLDAR